MSVILNKYFINSPLWYWNLGRSSGKRDASAKVSKRQVMGSKGCPTQLSNAPGPRDLQALEAEHLGSISSLLLPHQRYASLCACLRVRTTATASLSASQV